MKQIVIISSHLQKFFKIGVLKDFSKPTRKHVGVSFWLACKPLLFQNETSTQMLSCDFCETFENIIFTEHLRTTASVFMEHIGNIKKPSFNYSLFPKSKLRKLQNFFSFVLFCKICLQEVKLKNLNNLGNFIFEY